MKQQTKKRLLGLGLAGAGLFTVNAVVEAREQVREKQEVSRVTDVAAAAAHYLDGRIIVEEIEREGRAVRATLEQLGGTSIYRACEVFYNLHPNDNSTFDPKTLNIGDCL